MGYGQYSSNGGASNTMTSKGKQREVYEGDTIAHMWAHGLDKGQRIRNGGRNNFFAEGDTIYSYGHHFPIAKRVEVIDPETKATRVQYFVNPNGYSVTTNGHKYTVRGAIPKHCRSWHVPPTHKSVNASGGHGYAVNLWDEIGERSGVKVADYYNGEILQAAKDAQRPRIRHATRQGHLDRIAELVAEWRELHRTFRLRCSVDRVKAPTGDAMEHAKSLAVKHAADVKRERAAAAKREAEAEALRAVARERRRVEALRYVSDWRRGMAGVHWRVRGTEDDSFCWSIKDVGYPLLRLDDKALNVETSFGAEVDAADARRLLGALPALLARGGIDEGYKVGGYSGVGVNRTGVTIGCHRIPWAEVVAFCAHVGWPLPEGIPPADATDGTED